MTDIARSLDDTLTERQEGCDCPNPYWCNGEEMEEVK